MKIRMCLLFFSLIVISCGKNYTSEEKEYISKIEKHRQKNDDFMKNNPDSPFNFKGKVHFEPLKYYEPDPNFVFKSELYGYNKKDTIVIFGTKGEERKVVRYGYVKLNYKDDELRVNVYEGTSKSGEKYFSIWFTDKTTGEETYGVGRYIDFELNPDKDFIYTIDFNLAYNPYCAYSPDYSCAIPTKEDYIALAIEAGEKNFH
ncbi:MAG: hypothetical protein A2V93_06435 [Ignavibacteria bacterium RBG_16_34_14]|nr:MAG: hypothetical protein A2V93_06435 [Ignavibacteria bacterium RBG_16_34_14]